MRLRVYLDTSVVSACVDDCLPERKGETVRFWDHLAKHDVFVSDLTMAEIQATRDPATGERMMQLIHPFTVLAVKEEARELAHEYVTRGVFSAATVVPSMWPSLLSQGAR